MFWRSFYIKSRKAALYWEGRALSLTFKNGNDVTDLSVPLLTQGGKEVVMTDIAQHSLIPTFNWLLIVEKGYNEWKMDTQLKTFCHCLSHSIILSLVPEFYSKRTRNYPHHHGALIMMKMYSLLNTVSLHLNWNDKVGFHLSRVQCQDMRALRALVLTLGPPSESPGKLYPRAITSQTLGVGPRYAYFIKLF